MLDVSTLDEDELDLLSDFVLDEGIGLDFVVEVGDILDEVLVLSSDDVGV